MPTRGSGGAGATTNDWSLFSLELGLTEDLLPVVSRPDAPKSPSSKLGGLGKTPSTYNRDGHVVGFTKWTSHHATTAEIDRWMRQADYGICIQTRHVRALDVDVTDPELAGKIHDFIQGELHWLGLPRRGRAGSSKFLLAFRIEGDFAKRRLRVGDGQYIEFLATGQQFVAAGTHPSGARYEWSWPDECDDFPTLTAAEFEALWAALVKEFGIEEPHESKLSTRNERLRDARSSDPVAQYLLDKGWVKGEGQGGKLFITCPWEEEHSDGVGDDTSTVYFPAHTGGYERGHFECLHASHVDKTDGDFLAAVGYRDLAADDFEVLGEAQTSPEFSPVNGDFPFKFRTTQELRRLPPLGYHVKGVLPRVQVAMMYGASGAGKSFVALDMAAAIVQGQEWNGHRVRRGRVAYIAAEDAYGVAHRIKAYEEHHGVVLEGLTVLGRAPNIMEQATIDDLVASLPAGAEVIVLDTLARATPGANENAGEDMGVMLRNCQDLAARTGATVVLVHHSGKDATKGARGWSGIKAAVDVEIEISRDGAARKVTLTKVKNGIDGLVYEFELRQIEMGVDEDGDPVTSCLCSWGVTATSKRARYKPKGALEQEVLNALSVIEMDQTAGIEVDAVVELALMNMGKHEGEGKDYRGKNLRRAIEGLAKKGLFLIEDGTIELGEKDE